jgi:(p)ppGpp synthase/HD superfamily hydrolase
MLIDTRRVQHALAFAAKKHGDKGQMRSVGIPYMAHPYAVTGIIQNCAPDYGTDLEDALCAAALHDTIEDTDTTLAEVRKQFGDRVGYAVYALTKDKSITDKLDQLIDSLERSMLVGRWVVGIKCSDRIENLSFVTIPESWSRKKRIDYVHKEASIILAWGRKAGMDLTCERLEQVMRVYDQYIPPV